MPSTPLNVYHTRVRSYLTDLYGVMNHGAYLDVFDDARIETFRRLGYTYEWMQAGGWSLVIRKLQCEYFRPAQMDELLNICVHIAGMSAATMTIKYDCRRGDELLATAQTTYIFLDSAGALVRIPAAVRKSVEEHGSLLFE